MARPEALPAKINPDKTNGHILKALPPITRVLLPEDMEENLIPEPAFDELVAIERKQDNLLGKIRQNDLAEMPTALQLYFAEVGRGRLLTFQEELTLGRAVQAGLAASANLSNDGLRLSEDQRLRLEKEVETGQQARHKFIDHNLRLVISVAVRYKEQGVPFADLIQEGNLGLYHAVEKFDPERGFRFSTYAYWWIRQKVIFAIINQSRTIRISYNSHLLLGRLDQYTQQRIAETGCDPTIEEVCAVVGVNKERAEELLMIARRRQISLNSKWFPWNQDDNSEIGDHIEDPTAANLQEDAVTNVSRGELRDILEILLNPREWTVIRLRYGFDDGVHRTLEEAGAELGVSRERVRQVEAQALAKLYQPENLDILSQFRNEQPDQI